MERIRFAIALLATSLFAYALGCDQKQGDADARPVPPAVESATVRPSKGTTAMPPRPARAPSSRVTASGQSKLAPSSRAKPQLAAAPGWGDEKRFTGTLKEQNELLFTQLSFIHELDERRVEELRRVFASSSRLSQGNPRVSRHPVSPVKCLHLLKKMSISYYDPQFEGICGQRFMAPLYDPEKQQPGAATTCIDQFEFPNIPCVYPVTWVRANEAVQLCRAVGKRLCDAHE